VRLFIYLLNCRLLYNVILIAYLSVLMWFITTLMIYKDSGCGYLDALAGGKSHIPWVET